MREGFGVHGLGGPALLPCFAQGYAGNSYAGHARAAWLHIGRPLRGLNNGLLIDGTRSV